MFLTRKTRGGILNAKVIKCRTLSITTNGLAEGTKVKIDGALLRDVVGLSLDVDAKEPSISATVETKDDKENIYIGIFKFMSVCAEEGVQE